MAQGLCIGDEKKWTITTTPQGAVLSFYDARLIASIQVIIDETGRQISSEVLSFFLFLQFPHTHTQLGRQKRERLEIMKRALLTVGDASAFVFNGAREWGGGGFFLLNGCNTSEEEGKLCVVLRVAWSHTIWFGCCCCCLLLVFSFFFHSILLFFKIQTHTHTHTHSRKREKDR